MAGKPYRMRDLLPEDPLVDHLPDADLRLDPHGRASPPQRTAAYLETLLDERQRELAEARAEIERLRAQLTRHFEE